MEQSCVLKSIEGMWNKTYGIECILKMRKSLNSLLTACDQIWPTDGLCTADEQTSPHGNLSRYWLRSYMNQQLYETSFRFLETTYLNGRVTKTRRNKICVKLPLESIVSDWTQRRPDYGGNQWKVILQLWCKTHIRCQKSNLCSPSKLNIQKLKAIDSIFLSTF